MNSDDSSASAPAAVAIRRLSFVLIPVAIATVLADFLFWKKSAGISVGIFFTVLATLLLALVRHRPQARLTLLFRP